MVPPLHTSDLGMVAVVPVNAWHLSAPLSHVFCVQQLAERPAQYATQSTAPTVFNVPAVPPEHCAYGYIVVVYANETAGSKNAYDKRSMERLVLITPRMKF